MEGDAAVGTSSSSIATITGYLAGNPVSGASGIINFSASAATNGGITYTNNGIGGNGGMLTYNSNWQNLDEIRITGTDLVFGIDNLDFALVVTATLPVTLSYFKASRLRKPGAVEMAYRNGIK